MVPRDTSAVAARVQMDLLRRASVERRAELACSLSRTMIELSRRALAERMPGASEQEVLLRWVELHYGATLGRAVREQLARRGSGAAR